MADRNSRLSVKRKEKKVESKTNNEKDKEKEKVNEKIAKKPEKPTKKPEKVPEQQKKDEEKRNGENEGAASAEAKNSDENGEFQPIELPPFEIVTGEQMSPFYFKFQFRNVEYSSGRNKTLLCFRVDTPGGSVEPLKGYMEDEHATAHAEEAFFEQVLPNASQECDVTWYVSSSPCVSCAAKLATILQQRKKLRLCIFCSRLFEWEEPEIAEGLKALVRAGCKLRMMKPSDFLHVWETYVEKEDQSFTPWEDCQENYNYYVEKLADILK
ncbi:C-_U-editing enzyme APOBEC-2b [Archocentrus centrarchus]|uniref:C->U-editing enzyme APOBEC-2b n=1 Tax=Archocentrus centrarchus TaxID=63155 RepID=UPI0011E9E0AF|nr:C->U-editing enzyme APOBEC-2 [Archocentrus centrarchus]XP_030589136.1 C->U-editing enzyme APOBEC-2 [Archocentrus centrarchus]